MGFYPLSLAEVAAAALIEVAAAACTVAVATTPAIAVVAATPSTTPAAATTSTSLLLPAAAGSFVGERRKTFIFPKVRRQPSSLTGQEANLLVQTPVRFC
ncbi:hypothetical protein Taro_044658 [Colocasia esculenta]|uniref:Secreted protein n=1 Tax=Colocasia esculenta TaxID=4460 RepID=A0A843WP95_COLES|nr:hypothetical protein [Colocasia esculenta]